MIFRLEYCNKESVTARVDIQKGGATPIYTVEGTAEPFVLFYNNDKGDKSGSFRSSGADISIYETAEFNIDELKTSNETEISVKYYINNILNWSGFVIPDFFSETITGGKGVVSMVASDRLGTLKGATLSGLSAKVSNRELAEDCLAQTGLSLPLYTMAEFTGDGTNIFNSEVLSQRMVDTKGRNVSCYDILSSILEETNSLIVQRNGAWYIVNKLQLEAGSGSLYSTPTTSSAWVENTVGFDEVSVGARRTIKPVAATVGVYHEHGGGRLHPDNYDFSGGSTGWVSPNGFPFTIVNNQVKQYEKVGSTWNVEFGGADRNRMQINKQWDGLPANLDVIQYVSNSFPVVTTSDDSVTVGIDISVTGNPLSIARFTVLAEGDGKRFAFNPSSGAFEEYDDAESKFLINISPSGPYLGDNKYDAANEAIAYSAKLNVENISDYNISIRVYGTNIPIISGGGFAPMFVDFASVKFSNTAEVPKGNIFKTTQGANYTKDHEIPTVLWGDYLTYGLNGYFYSYPIDDTSSLYRPTGELHSRWTAYGDPDTLPLLQHITRQKSRMFSVAHDLLSADITASTFDPLSIFVDCDSTRYVVVSARFDFLLSNVSVELEEIAYATNSKRDYIYSYFGDGEDGISSIGGISGGSGGGSTGGGLTPEQLEILSFWKKDPDNPNTIFTEMNAYSKLELSAYGVGDGGGGGGGGSTVVWGTLTNGYRQLTVEGVTYALAQNTHKHLWADITDKPSTFTPSVHSHGWSEITGKPSTFTPSAHTHSAGDITSGTFAIARIPTGTTSSTVALGNHTHSWSSITSKPSTFEPSAHTHLWADITDKPSTFMPSAHTHAIADVTGLQTALDGKAASAHTHSASDITSGTFAIARIPTGTTSSTVALGNHLHTGVYEPGFSKNTGFNKDFGTTAGTVAEGNHTHTFASLSSKPTTLPGYGITDAVTLNTAQTITGLKTFDANIILGVNRYIQGTDNYTGVWNVDNKLWKFGSSSTGSVSNIRSEKVGVGTDSPSEKLHVAGNILATGATTTTKVIFNTAGWSLEQVGTELQLKYNNVVAQRFLLDGSIVGLGEITAYGATTGGEGVSLLRTGGTMTGNLTMSADIIMNSGRAIGISNLPLKLLGNALTYNASNVLTEANTATQIKMGNGWTIEQTTSALTIKKNGVVKGTFNA